MPSSAGMRISQSFFITKVPQFMPLPRSLALFSVSADIRVI